MPNAPTPTAARPRTVRVLGIDFFAGSIADACERATDGGLLTAPSGPGLAYDLPREPSYRRALEESDVVLTDSAFMVILWRLRTGYRLPRNSGLGFLRVWMNRPIMRRPGAVFWVMPSTEDQRQTQIWLRRHGYPVDDADFYLAPRYSGGAIVDPELTARVEQRRPEVVYLGIGGGVQERLGHGLRSQLSYRPLILCLGAALAFMTGAQVRIPPWVDRCGLGWIWRILSDPARFSLRYVRALRLAGMVLRHGAEPPPGRGVSAA